MVGGTHIGMGAGVIVIATVGVGVGVHGEVFGKCRNCGSAWG